MALGIDLGVMKNIQDYMVEKLSVDKSIILELCIILYNQVPNHHGHATGEYDLIQ